MNQREWLRSLQRLSSRPMKLAQEREGEHFPSVWKAFNEWQWDRRVDHRTVLPNEVILDNDLDDWDACVRNVLAAKARVRALGFADHTWRSGGRGLHVSVFIDMNGLEVLYGDRLFREQLWEHLTWGLDGFDRGKAFWDDDAFGTMIRAEGSQGRSGGFKVPVVDLCVETERLAAGAPWFPNRLTLNYPDPLMFAYPAASRQGCHSCQAVTRYDDREMGRWVGCLICEGQLGIRDLPVRRDKQARRRVGGVLPCIRSEMDKMSAGVHIPHQARFSVATHLKAVGWGREAVHEVFKPDPRYNHDETNRQLAHIFSRDYGPPSCEKMYGYGMCLESCPLRRAWLEANEAK